jgi:hypothetical protein
MGEDAGKQKIGYQFDKNILGKQLGIKLNCQRADAAGRRSCRFPKRRITRKKQRNKPVSAIKFFRDSVCLNKWVQ